MRLTLPYCTIQFDSSRVNTNKTQVVSVVDAQDLNCVIQPASYVKKVCDKLPRLWDEENIVSWMTCLDLQVL